MAKKRKERATVRVAAQDLRVDTKPPLLTYLNGILGSLTRAERLIADCVLADPERVVTSAIAEVRRTSSASVGSIVAFCRRLGFKGFADFKIGLATDLAQSGLSAGELPADGSLFEKVFHFHSQSLVETLRINVHSAFERASKMLETAGRIEFFSIGLSYPVAYTACCKFLLLGLRTAAQSDAHIQLIAATQLKPGDIAFGISCSGATRETVQCLEVAKARGATTICLTNAMKSPLTLVSDICLYATPSEIKYFQAPLASRITQLAVIDALFVSLALKSKSNTAKRLQESAEALLKRRNV